MIQKRMAEIKLAILEAERFIEKAKDVRAEMHSGKYDTWYSKKNATMKRSSLDLSSALVKIRKPLGEE